MTTEATEHEGIHDGTVPMCRICDQVNQIKLGGMNVDGSMSQEQQAAATASALTQLPPELQQVITSGQGAAGIRATLGFYQDVLSGTKDEAPRPGDPRVQLAMACLQMSPENVLPGLKRACYAVISAALFMRPAVEDGEGAD